MNVISGEVYNSLFEMPSTDGQSEKLVAAVLQTLADARREKEVTLEKLSEMSGVDHGVISRAERGLRIPAMASIRDLAVALGLDFADVVKNAEDRVRGPF
jgi:transcriptional regulator with XRE-family HTH domain